MSDPRVEVDVAIVGSGFAGSLLARALRGEGLRVALLERVRHPRFALGESSTPLANLALERLARRYGLADLWELAAHGRWLESHPELGRGLKRGFTFYRQPTGARFQGGEREGRLLVAASPDDGVADTHWLRADVDRHFAERAVAEGALLIEGVETILLDLDERGVELALGGPGDEHVEAGQPPRPRSTSRLRCGFLVDASGSGGFVARALGIGAHPAPLRFASRLLYSHFGGVPRFAEVEPAAASPADPYAADWAAVHHLSDTGWMYQLRFDDGTVSAGVLVDPSREERLGVALSWHDPGVAWQEWLDRHPSLALQFRGAEPLRPIVATPGPIQRRAAQAAGARWAMLPQAYGSFDALYSTGIAWSLLAVERLAMVLGAAHADGGGVPADPPGLEAYAGRLEAEADQLERLLTVGYRQLADFERFAGGAQLYFALASFEETRQRLLEPQNEARCRVGELEPSWAWDGFLGALDPVAVELLEGALERTGADGAAGATPAQELRWARAAIAARNVAGLCDEARHPLYPVDFEAVVEGARLLGLEPAEARRRLPRLISPRRFPGRSRPARRSLDG
ncbi:MAG TPA: NAD(P)-binding protein [Thermoanaerobaculia bacterium]|nr:NAD(P)-binding protein [Thermoanaerobaculia bacterium]